MSGTDLKDILHVICREIGYRAQFLSLVSIYSSENSVIRTKSLFFLRVISLINNYVSEEIITL